MSNTPSDPSARQGGNSPAFDPFKAAEPTSDNPLDDVLPSWDIPAPPLAIPVEVGPADAQQIPLAMPVAPLALPVGTPPSGGYPVALPVAPASPNAPPPPPVVEEPLPSAPPPAPTTLVCPACTSVSPIDAAYCSDCGYYFSDADRAVVSSPTATAPTATFTVPSSSRLNDRYVLSECYRERSGVEYFRALDHASDPPTSVVIIRQTLPPVEPPPAAPAAVVDAADEILPSFDDPHLGSFPPTAVISSPPSWPGVGWIRRLLHTLEHPGLPAQIDHFSDEVCEYLVVESPQGRSLWDAWEDTELDASKRFGYLVELAERLVRLHQCNTILESLRPDLVVIDPSGQVRLTDVSELLPLPVPEDAPLRGGLYTAPELMTKRDGADARADIYGFGALLYSLMLGRELNEKTDFDDNGTPKLFSRFPDLHPGYARLMLKTLRKEVEARFPTDEARREDETGFSDLIRALRVLGRTHDHVRLEVASWTSTGIVRTGNEDAFAVLHAVESRQDDLGEASLVLLCDGMGGYEAGEVAAALTIQSLRQTLGQLRPFNVAAGASPFTADPLAHTVPGEGHQTHPYHLEEVKATIKSALRDANKLVFQTSRAPGSKRRGMGCTAEVVYVDGRHVIVGHVGDSRTYHLHEGNLIQLTRDQTLVNRLVELGNLSPAEAETHPRRNELQQAIGGQPDVEPGLYHGTLRPGDWVIVCSDGLTNHISARDLQQMLHSEAMSAEMAARRLINLTLIEGATDNVTVVAIRAT